MVMRETGAGEGGRSRFRGMATQARVWVIGLAAVVLVFAAGHFTRPGAQEPPPVSVTTDTAEYCAYLSSLVGERVRGAPASLAHEAADLSSEGQWMCNHGQVRGGILRLRRALVLL